MFLSAALQDLKEQGKQEENEEDHTYEDDEEEEECTYKEGDVYKGDVVKNFIAVTDSSEEIAVPTLISCDDISTQFSSDSSAASLKSEEVNDITHSYQQHDFQRSVNFMVGNGLMDTSAWDGSSDKLLEASSSSGRSACPPPRNRCCWA